MVRILPSPKVGLSLALGCLLASASVPARAEWSPANESALGRPFDLVAADRAAELPAELRAQEVPAAPAAVLGLADAAGRHRVKLHWVVREHGDLSGYRVTLVAPEGLPGHLAARWFVAPAAGVPLGDGLTAYSAELSLALDEPAPISAAVEAVDLAGHSVLLGVRRSIADAEPTPRQVGPVRSESWTASPVALQANRFAPTAQGAASSPAFYPPVTAARLAAAPATHPKSLEPGGAVSPRGPPTETVTT